MRTITPDIKTCIFLGFSPSNDLTWRWQHKRAAQSVFPRGGPPNALPLALLVTKDALREIPLGLTVIKADFPVLRVVVSWEGDANLDRSMSKTDETKNMAGKKDKAKDPPARNATRT